jgi:ATP-dependent RNA helicase RhlE
MPAKSSAIRHEKYINAAVEPEQEEVYIAKHSFADFGLDEQILNNVLKHGYKTPTPIQDQAIPVLMQGRDVVGIANTGTGKTAAFLLPLIHKVLRDPDQGVLILAPTRELALQIEEEFQAFTKNLATGVVLCIGGMNINPQIAKIRRNPQFVIGTPGRIKDLIQRGVFDTSMYANVVLDEVDRMLDIGFRPDIQFLISKLPKQRHAAFFSATMNRETEQIMYQLLSDPVEITVKKRETSQHIEQDIVRVQAGENKVDVLHTILTQDGVSRAIVFGRTKHGINKLEKQLQTRGIRVSAIHGNKTQSARQKALQDFKQGRVQALLATDIAARGIDVEDVSHVINYDEPQTYEDYVHRIGRTGRAGKTGKALTFVS